MVAASLLVSCNTVQRSTTTHQISEVMETKHKYSVSDNLREIGEEIFRYDLSFAHEIVNGKIRELTPTECTTIKNHLKAGSAMKVLSYPVEHSFVSDERFDICEYFIEVQMVSTGTKLFVINSKYSTFRTHEEMLADLERCKYSNRRLRND
jgi:hypothetical protein